MTPTPSHVATDELIETLERLEKESVFRSDDFGLFVSNHLPALISAIKENKRLREALTDLVSAVDDGEHDHSNVENEPCETCSAWLRASAALQPQGEK